MLMNKEIKMSDYLEFTQPKYIYLKIIPCSSLRNYNSDKLLTLIANLYTSIDKRVKRINNKLFFECSAKVSYYIYIEHNKVEFYFIVPEKHYNLFKDKINSIWNGKITIKKVDIIPNFKQDCTKYYLTYKKEDALSLNCDKRDNYLLSSLLNVLNVIQEGDKIGILFNFQSCNQKTWIHEYKRTMDKIDQYKPIDKNIFTKQYVIKKIISIYINVVDFGFGLFEMMLGGGKKEINNNNKIKQELSHDTLVKANSSVVKTQIFCMSESTDENREKDNILSVCNSFGCIDSDNKLIYKKYQKNIKRKIIDKLNNNDDNNYLLDNLYIPTMKMQPKEGQNFIEIAGDGILKEYNCIEHIDINERPVPKCLQHGYINIGENIYKDTKTKAYFMDDIDIGSMPAIEVGEQGSGKTTLIVNNVKDISEHDEGCMVIDFIKNCELSENIKRVVNKGKIIELDLSNPDDLQGFGYNELQPKNNNISSIIEIANRKALFIESLIDALNNEIDELSSSMERYLISACNIVMLNDNSCLRDVVKCLNDYKYRKKILENIEHKYSNKLKYMQEDIDTLKELNDDKNESTRFQLVNGINHRINTLKKDFRLKAMFNNDCSNNIDLVKAMDEGKIVLVKMPQEYFSTSYSINVLVTYLYTKIWCAALIRGGRKEHPKRFHIFTDEVFQAKTAMRLLNEQQILPQTRKFNVRFVFTAQYLGQIQEINKTLYSAGASYMLLKGSGRTNFVELKNDLEPYTIEDMSKIKQYYSLNLINTKDGLQSFITKLPKPL